MSEQLKERKDMDPAYEWDLTTLYQNDEEWEKALADLDHYAAELAAYKGKLTDADSILACLNLLQEAARKIEDVFCYASLRHSEDTRDAAAQAMYSRAFSKYTLLSSAAAFINPEILSLPDEKLKEITADEKLKDYRFKLEDLIRQKPHTLSTSEETLLTSFQEAISASGDTAETLMDADLVFDSVKDSQGSEHEVTGSSYIPLQMSTDRVLRENAFHSYYKSYKQHIHTFASAYAGCVKGAVAEARVRGYSSSREMAMSSDNIPVSVYDNLISAVRANMDKMYRYVSLRKKILGLDELHYYDVYAPLAGDIDKKYTYEEAKEMVCQAVSPLGEEYVERVRNAYKDGWIDVYPNKGKSGGAYSSGTYDSNPFIMMNFTGSLDSVSTLAHEMGHSQHTWLTNHHQPAQYAGYTMFVAEVASTVNENLLIEQLLRDCDDPKERLYLLNQYLEGFKGTVYRQTMFAEFEKEAHAMQERGESLDADALCHLYEGLIKDYFGSDLVMDEEVQYEWARIPHFYRPFYVYVYATGYTSAVALSEGILKEGKPAADRYLEFLSMGSSAYPLDELRHGGVDLSTPEPIQRALDKFDRVLDDVEETLKKLGR
jgi:oligoendopeptidase F